MDRRASSSTGVCRACSSARPRAGAHAAPACGVVATTRTARRPGSRASRRRRGHAHFAENGPSGAYVDGRRGERRAAGAARLRRELSRGAPAASRSATSAGKTWPATRCRDRATGRRPRRKRRAWPTPRARGRRAGPSGVRRATGAASLVGPPGRMRPPPRTTRTEDPTGAQDDVSVCRRPPAGAARPPHRTQLAMIASTDPPSSWARAGVTASRRTLTAGPDLRSRTLRQPARSRRRSRRGAQGAFERAKATSPRTRRRCSSLLPASRAADLLTSISAASSSGSRQRRPETRASDRARAVGRPAAAVARR